MRSYGLAISGSDSCFYIPTTHTTISTRRPIPDPKPNFFFPKPDFSFRSGLGSLRLEAKAAINDGVMVAEHKELTFYELLGIPESGSVTQIKQAYKLLARKYHPDVSPPDRVEENTEKFIRVQEAYETLSDSRRRAMYDRDMARGLHLAFSARRCQYDEVFWVVFKFSDDFCVNFQGTFLGFQFCYWNCYFHSLENRYGLHFLGVEFWYWGFQYFISFSVLIFIFVLLFLSVLSLCLLVCFGYVMISFSFAFFGLFYSY